MARFCRQLHYSRDVNKTFLQDQDFYFRPRARLRLQKFSKTKTKFFFGQDQDQDLAPQDQDLHTVSDNLAKDSYKPYTWLNKIM